MSNVIDMMTRDVHRRIPDYTGSLEEAEILCKRIESYYHSAGYPTVKVWIERFARKNQHTQAVVGFHYNIRSNIKFTVPK